MESEEDEENEEEESTGKNSTGKKKVPHVYEYEVNWTTTRFQSKSLTRFIPASKVMEGMSRFSQVTRGQVLQWEKLVQAPINERITFDMNPDELDEYEGPLPDHFYEEYATTLNNHEDVEQVGGLSYSINEKNDTPDDLFMREDGSTETRIKESSRKIFSGSASSCFFAYLPRAFWGEVLEQTNEYAKEKKQKEITMDELMKFLGILFYMAVKNQGEMKTYWGKQVEDELLNTESLTFDRFMTFDRFKFIRSNLCFNCDVTPEQLKQDPAARIRPLINTLKLQSTRHVDIGRNVSVDEASVACRSKYARSLIVYNATKPTGKYHFKIYVCACASTWLAFNFKLHCAADMQARLQGTLQERAREQLEKDLKYSAEVRKHVLEVTYPIYGSNRIVNTDNFYTSAALLMSYRTVGLYGRGTVRKGSKNFPQYVILPKHKEKARGEMIIAVNKSNNIVAASWMDGAIVNMLSNADSSGVGTVTRQIKQEKVPFKAPMVVKKYNAAMQGVDRLDQLRSRFSICDGHSFKKWHKKLAMAFIDIARVNAYVTRKLVMESDNHMAQNPEAARDLHRYFVLELVGDLLNQRWMDAIDTQTLMVGITEEMPGSTPGSTPKKPLRSIKSLPSPQCDAYASKDALTRLGKTSRDARGCVVCKHEGRYPTTLTDYCYEHKVCLCRKLYTRDEKDNEGLFLETSKESEEYHYNWSCWNKFHLYYLPKGLFNRNGNIMKNSNMNQESKKLRTERDIKRKAKKLQLERERRTVNSLNQLQSVAEEVEENLNDISSFQVNEEVQANASFAEL